MRLIDADKIIQISIHVPAWGTTDGTYAVLTDQGISIHVPAWGTTYHHHGITHNRQFQSTFPRGERRRTVWHQQSIICQFQSTFPRGERPDMRRCYQKNKNFNPRSRVGNDTLFLFHASAKPISIHVPAWGTTVAGKALSTSVFNISIHVPAWGTTVGIFIQESDTGFQSTFPRGERQHVPQLFR